MTRRKKSQSHTTLDSRDRAAYARMVTRLFCKWQITDADQLAILGIKEDSMSILRHYRDGKPLSNSRDLIDRVAYLFDIHSQLRSVFPNNNNLVYGWMTARIADFNHLTPIHIIKSHGIVGMNMLHTYLSKVSGE